MEIENKTVTAADIPSQLLAVSLEDVASRHRRERKELQAKIQAIKKNAPKNDKKKRKEAMELVSHLETDLEQRHQAELKASEEQQTNKANQASLPEAVTFVNTTSTSDDENVEYQHNHRVSRAQKRRDKKAREVRAREAEIEALALSTDHTETPKAIELRELLARMKERQLKLHYISSDGDCLYNAVRHQLLQYGLPAFSVQELRNETANYIAANKDTLHCFMTNPNTGEILDDNGFAKYCNDIRSTSAWGGQVELNALSSILKVPIEVLQAQGPPMVQGSSEFAGPKLVITYHRYMYQLGEHYNSTIPVANENFSDDNE